MKKRKGFRYAGKTVLSLSLASAVAIAPATQIFALESGVAYKTGTFYGKTQGFRNAEVEVAVTIAKDGNAYKINEVKANSTPLAKADQSYWEKAVTLTEQIKEKNGTEGVDTVSGATISSKAILKAANLAIAAAKNDENYCFDGGEGTKASPYLIASAKTFRAFSEKVNEGVSYAQKYIELNKDIDLSGEEWTPIGTAQHPFDGYFNGKAHKISGLTIGSKTAPKDLAYAGLFGYALNTAVFERVNVEDASVYLKTTGKTGAYAGLVLAYAKVDTKTAAGTVLNRCKATGKIQVDTQGNSAAMAGGIIGFINQYGVLANSEASVDVEVSTDGKPANAGGFVGFSSINGLMINNYADGAVTVKSENESASSAGGFAGGASGLIYNCVAAGTASSENEKVNVGGLAGNVTNAAFVKSSYYLEGQKNAAGKVSGVVDKTVKSVSTAQLQSASFAEELQKNLTGKNIKSFAEEISKTDAVKKLDYQALADRISQEYYCWQLSEKKLTHTDDVYVDTEPDADIFAAGDGTKEHPYEISNEKQLRDFAKSLNDFITYKDKYVVVTDNIEIGKEEWVPVGQGEYAFEGNFDGWSHTISNLNIGTKNQPYEDQGEAMYGLFTALDAGAVVKNLNLNVSFWVQGDATVYVGGVTGYLNKAEVNHVTVTGNVFGKSDQRNGYYANNFVGGIAGYLSRGKIVNSNVTGDLRSESTGAIAECGGIAGLSNRGLVANSYVRGNISGTSDRSLEGMPSLGGIVGVHAGTIVNCYADTSVIAECYSQYVGAISGWATGIADTFQSYYNKEAVLMTGKGTKDEQKIAPAIPIGWAVGAGTNDEGVPFTGSVTLNVEGLEAKDFTADHLAGKLNENLKKLNEDLENGGRQQGFWSGSKELADSVKTWVVSDGIAKPEGKAQTPVYAKEQTEAAIKEILKKAEPKGKAGIYYGRSEDKSLVVSLLVEKDGTYKEIKVVNGTSDEKTNQQIAEVLKNADTEKLEDGNFKQAIEKAIEKAKKDDATRYGKATDDLFAGGKGTKEDPWQIANETQLRNFALNVNEDESYKDKYVVLTQSITLTSDWQTAGGQASSPWPFSGHFDGKGYTISNLKIGKKEAPATMYFGGFFAYVYGGTVKNVRFDHAEIYMENVGGRRMYAGILAGCAEGRKADSYFDEIEVNGIVSAHTDSSSCTAAGIVGQMTGGALTNSTANVEVTANSNSSSTYAAALVALPSWGIVMNNKAKGKVTSEAPMNKASIGGVGGFNAGVCLNNVAEVELIAKNSTTDVGAIAGRHTGIAYLGNSYYDHKMAQQTGSTRITKTKAVGVQVNDEIYNVKNYADLTQEEIVQALNKTNLAADNKIFKDGMDTLKESYGITLPEDVKFLSWKTTDDGIELVKDWNRTTTNNVTKPADDKKQDTATNNTKTKNTTTVKKSIKKGMIIKLKKGKSAGVYRVISTKAGKVSVSYQKAYSKKQKKVVIPATITIQGKKCKVTQIANYAFKNQKNLVSVSVGRNVTKIGKNAWKNATSLKKIVIKNKGIKVTRIGKNAFETGTKTRIVLPGKNIKKVFEKKYQKKSLRFLAS